MASQKIRNVTRKWLKSIEQAVFNATSLMRSDSIRRLLQPRRDINYECGYPDTIVTADYEAMYDREGFGTRVVNILPEEGWAEIPDVYENEDDTETAFEKAWKELVDRIPLWSYMETADILSGIGRYGGLLFGVGDGKLETPAPGIDKKTGELTAPATGGEAQLETLHYVRPLREGELEIVKTEADKLSPRYGKPVSYRVKFSEQQGATFDVHWTRIVHLADNRTSSDVYGEPRMRNVYNRLLDAQKILAGSGEMFWKGGFPGYSVEVHPDLGDVEMDTDSIKDEFEKHFGGLQRFIALEGVTAKSLAPQVADPTRHLEAQLKAIALAKGIPWRIFLGSEQAKLASTADKQTWDQRIARRQERYQGPMIVRPVIERLQAFGVLPRTEKPAILKWPDRNAPSDKEIAEIGKIQTEAMAKYEQANVDNLIPPFEFLTMVLGFDDDEARAIEKAAKERIEQEETFADQGVERATRVAAGIEGEEETPPAAPE